MSASDLVQAVGQLASVCALIVVLECAAGNERSAEGFRAVCGLAAVLTVIRAGAGWFSG